MRRRADWKGFGLFVLCVAAPAQAGDRGVFRVVAEAMPVLLQGGAGASNWIEPFRIARVPTSKLPPSRDFVLVSVSRWQPAAPMDFSNFDRFPIAGPGPRALPVAARSAGETMPIVSFDEPAELPRSSFDRWSSAAASGTGLPVPRFHSTSPFDASLVLTLRGDAPPALDVGGGGMAGVLWGAVPKR